MEDYREDILARSPVLCGYNLGFVKLSPTSLVFLCNRLVIN